jgi:hypothetical protein
MHKTCSAQRTVVAAGVTEGPLCVTEGPLCVTAVALSLRGVCINLGVWVRGTDKGGGAHTLRLFGGE